MQAARSGSITDSEPRSWFTGRRDEVNQVVGWVTHAQPGICVVTGSAGTGKSAIVGRVVSAADQDERRVLEAAGPLGHNDPHVGRIQAHVHARGRTADQVAGLLADHLTETVSLDFDDEGDTVTAAGLVAAIANHTANSRFPVVIVVDGLDEARDQALSIVDELLTPLAATCTVIVSTRDITALRMPSAAQSTATDPAAPTQPTTVRLIAELAPADTLNLDAPQWQGSARSAMHDYLTARLAYVFPSMDATLVAQAVVGGAQGRPTRPPLSDEPFLLVRIVADQLVDHPIDTSCPGWDAQLPTSIQQALDADLARVPAPAHRQLPGVWTPQRFARSLLTSLTWGMGAGFPREEWQSVASAPTGIDVQAADIVWLLESMSRHIVQDTDASEAVYRIAHQSLADHLRPAFVPSHTQPFDPALIGVCKALTEKYAFLLDSGLPAERPSYLRRYAYQHASAAGSFGLDMLRDVATKGGGAGLLPDLASASLSVSATFGQFGLRHEALPPTEEAVTLYRELAEHNPAYLPDLASSLNNLGGRLSNLGRRDEALPPTEEAVTLRRELAEHNPAYLPDLASSLNNLGGRLSNLGRRDEALPPTEEAVTLRRELAEHNPAYLPDLASSLNNLGISLSNLGRRDEALPPVEEAVTLYRQLAELNPAYLPDLAGSLTNLGIHLSELGRRDEALPPVEEAVTLYRQLAEHNPAHLPNLAKSLLTLAILANEHADQTRALASTSEGLAITSALAQAHPAAFAGLHQAAQQLAAMIRSQPNDDGTSTP